MMLCCETDAWNMWWMKLVKPQTKCRRHMLVRTRKIWPMHCRSCAGLFLCFWIFADMLRMLQDVMPKMWNVTMKSQTMQWVVHAGANKRKMTNGSWKMRRFICCVFFLLCFLTCSVCLLWNSVHVNRERCEERRSDKRCMKKICMKQMHEYRICTRSCMENFVSDKFRRISYHAECTWHAVAMCCFGETAC